MSCEYRMRWWTRRAARHARKALHHRGSHNRAERCPNCGGWHLNQLPKAVIRGEVHA
jgi:hypothetical protein